MRPIGRILVGVFAIALVASSSVAAEEEVTLAEIARSIEELSSPNAEVVRKATDRLTSVRSSEGITAILKSVQTAEGPVQKRICQVLGAIGEPAVEVVFAGSVRDPATGRHRVPWASHVLTSHLKTAAMPFLVGKLRSGEIEERKVAAWALWSITRYHGFGDSEPAALISSLRDAAAQDPVEYVKRYCTDALSNLPDDASIPGLVRLLSDKAVCGDACSALAQHGEKASEAIPMLKQGIKEGRLPATAFDALIAIQGKEAVPFVVEQLSAWRFGPNDRDVISAALLRHPHPAAVPFMEEELWEGNASSRVRAAVFLSALDHPASLKNMRACLSVLPKGKSERTHPLDTEVDCARDLRAIAIGYLADHRDAGSYDTILKMLKGDLSIKVRAAAAEGVGKVGYEKAIPALEGCFAVLDKGHSAFGHADGALHAAAVEALGNIGSPQAYQVLYDGAGQGHARKHCTAFWQDAQDRAVFERFLKCFGAAPLDAKTAAGIIADQLWTHREHYTLPKEQFADAKRRFLASVRDPDHFGPGVDLSKGGTTEVSMDFRFYTIDFVLVDFSFSSRQARGHGHGYTIVYRKHGKSWRPMAKVNSFVT